MARKVGKCPLHPDMDLYEHEKGGNTWRAHKMPDGTWCHPERGQENYHRFVPKKEDPRALRKYCLSLATKTCGAEEGADAVLRIAEKYMMWLEKPTRENIEEKPPF